MLYEDVNGVLGYEAQANRTRYLPRGQSSNCNAGIMRHSFRNCRCLGIVVFAVVLWLLNDFGAVRFNKM
jgi:hypothetical protein